MYDVIGDGATKHEESTITGLQEALTLDVEMDSPAPGDGQEWATLEIGPSAERVSPA